MRKMKDSGIEWIGEIPEGWEVAPVKRLCTMQAGKNLTSEQIAPEGIYPVYGGNGIRGFFSDYNCDGQFLTVGRQGALCGNVHKINGKVWATEHAVITTPSSYTTLDFLYYLLIGMDLNQYVSSTAAQPGLAVGTLLNLKTCYPCSTLEQTQISNYLNAKCSEIDVMLTKTRASIEEYKNLKQTVITQAVTKGVRGEREMKDSGVEWIGEIPAAWDVAKAKYCVTITHGSDPKTEGSIPVYGSGAESFKTCGEYKEGPTVLIGRKGATLHIPHYIEGKYWNVDTAFDVKAKNNFSLPYYYYLATSFDYKFYIAQTTLPGMTQSNYYNMFLPFPTFPEQEEIVNYLDAKCAEIDKLIAKKEQLVKELESYKKSLIYEVVTGKREV
ncbi:restriction endonuclease subunit S [Faecalibacterium sp. HTF-128]|uniref:Restriction endonuclease subunit S n=1 Tax=Faecalibacterium wellingii TaxID=2929491 RepID=A0AB35Y5H0_9FIRM